MKITFAFCLLLMMLNQTASSQTNREILDSIAAETIGGIHTSQKQEVFLQTDKTIYGAGENIWFSALILNSVSRKISTTSPFLFVDLVNEHDSTLDILILDAASNQLKSRIRLPETTPSGFYWLRAYTNQMAEKNVSAAFVKPIYVFGRTTYSSARKEKQNSTTANPAPEIRFYPEGGNIITGISSTVGLKASIGEQPLIIEGNITDDHDVLVARFKTNEYGLAKFDFEPAGNRKYKADINLDSKNYSFPLPGFDFYSGQIAVTQEPNSYKLRILLGDSIYTKDFVTYLIGVSKDSLFFAGHGKGLYELSMDARKLPEGICQFYLFDKNHKLLSERSLFSHGNQLNVNLSTDKKVYGKSKEIKLNVSVNDPGQQPVPSLISVAVIDTKFSGIDPKSSLPDIESASDKPDGFFLSGLSESDNETADLFMLLEQHTYPTESKQTVQTSSSIDSLLFIRGQVTSEKDEYLSDIIVTLVPNSANTFIYTDTTDFFGKFIFPTEMYPDSSEFILTTKNFKGKSVKAKITFDPIKYPKFSTPLSSKKYLDLVSKPSIRSFSAYYANSHELDPKQLPPVTITENQVTGDYNQFKRISNSSIIISGDDLQETTPVGFSTLKKGGLQMINGYVLAAGLTNMQGVGPGSEPIVLVDGVQIPLSSDGANSSPVMSYLNGLNPKDIDFIEILKGPQGANYGVRGGNGVILVNLLGRRRDLNPGQSNSTTYYATGVSSPVLFPNQPYQSKDNPAFPDHRSTLFWSGNFYTDQAKESTFTFYSNDVAGTYKVVVTGITQRGELIYKTLTFEIR